MILRLLIVVFFVTVTAFSQTPPIEPGVSLELAKWRAARYSNVRYKLNLTLEKMSPVLKGTIEIRVKVGTRTLLSAMPQSGVIVPPIILDWRKIKGFEDRSTISNVSLNGQPVKIFSPDEPAIADMSVRVPFEESNEHLIFRDGVVAGENVIKLDFTSPILTSGSAITRYVDKEDGVEYIYSLFVPSDASTAFPVFDQPDLKARFDLTVAGPTRWRVVSNEPSSCENSNETVPTVSVPEHIKTQIAEFKRLKKPSDSELRKYAECVSHFPENGWDYTSFLETKPISTYVFAFAAGPFTAVVDDGSVPRAVATGAVDRDHKDVTAKEKKAPVATAQGTDKMADVSTRIYVRKSQAEKFKPHAAEVFRLNREGIKYLETYFDYKFPFPKYDLVLIPEFPFGGMEHAGATFLREDRVIFPTEPTKNDYITRANLIFHEAAHQWFGDTVTMKWFDDLWLKEGFAEFMAYKTLEKVMPEYNAWKIFYERNKQAAYLTDSTKGTTPIYQEISNLNAAKSAYGNIVYRKAPSFLKQAEFYIGPDKFQTAVRAFLKKHEFKNAEWTDLVREFETASTFEKGRLNGWANVWVLQRSLSNMSVGSDRIHSSIGLDGIGYELRHRTHPDFNGYWQQKVKILIIPKSGERKIHDFVFGGLVGGSPGYSSKNFLVVQPDIPAHYIRPGMEIKRTPNFESSDPFPEVLNSNEEPAAIFPNYQDFGYGIFLLDDKSRDYVLKNIHNEKDDFLRTMMWGSLWDSVREAELAPEIYVELVVENLHVETDESTIQTLLGRVSTAMTYYMSEPPASAGGKDSGSESALKGLVADESRRPSTLAVVSPADAGGSDLRHRVENLLIERMQNATTSGQRITYYRAFLHIASTENARGVLKQMLAQTGGNLSGSEGVPGVADAQAKNTLPTGRVSATAARTVIPLKTKDRFDIVTKLLILGDPAAPALLAGLEKTETSDEAKRYAYAAKAGVASAENKAKFWNDFTNNKEISESWIESAFGPFNSPRHAEMTLPFLEKALAELPNLKRNRKIFFVNGWLGAFIGGQKSELALAVVNKFLADNPNLDKDLRLKILENVDLIERAVKIRGKYARN